MPPFAPIKRVVAPRVRVFSMAVVAAVGAFFGVASAQAGSFAPGDSIRLKQSETLIFMGKNLVGAPKGQQFVTLKQDFAQGVVYVAYVKEDGTLIAVTLPAEALELAPPPNGWVDMLQGVDAFRDQRYEDARRLLARAVQDPQFAQLAGPIAQRINGAITVTAVARSGEATAKQAFLTTLSGLRDTAAQLSKLGYLSLALPLDEGADRCVTLLFGATPPAPGAGGPAASKLDREDVKMKVTVSERCAARARQAIAVHKLYEASKCIEEGLASEPARPDLKAFKVSIKKDMEDADSRYDAANSMRRIVGGTVHALTALEMGLKECSDHPGLRELKKAMESAFEERTSPPVNPAFLAAAKVPTSAQALTEGHELYTNRCTECHDLDLVDSRSMSGWQKMVGSMSGRAHLSQEQQARILEYLAAAEIVVDAQKPQ